MRNNPKMTSSERNEELTTKPNRQKALESLESVQIIEQNKLNKGYKWITNDKLNKLAHPDNVKKYIYNGYRVISQNTNIDV